MRFLFFPKKLSKALHVLAAIFLIGLSVFTSPAFGSKDDESKGLVPVPDTSCASSLQPMSRLQRIWNRTKTALTADIRDIWKLRDPAIDAVAVVQSPFPDSIRTLGVRMDAKDHDLEKAVQTMDGTPFIEFQTKKDHFFRGQLVSKSPPEILVKGSGGKVYALRFKPKELEWIIYYHPKDFWFNETEINKDWVGSTENKPIVHVYDEAPLLLDSAAGNEPCRGAPSFVEVDSQVVTIDIGVEEPLTGIWVSAQPPILKTVSKEGIPKWLEIAPQRIQGTIYGKAPDVWSVGLKKGEPILVSLQTSPYSIVRGRFVEFDKEGDLTIKSDDPDSKDNLLKITRGGRAREPMVAIARDDSGLEVFLKTFNGDPQKALYSKGKTTINRQVGFIDRYYGHRFTENGSVENPSFYATYAPGVNSFEVQGFWGSKGSNNDQRIVIDDLKISSPEVLQLTKAILDANPPLAWSGRFSISWSSGKAQLNFNTVGILAPKIGGLIYVGREHVLAVMEKLKPQFPGLRDAKILVNE